MRKVLKVNLIPYFKKEGAKDEILVNIDTPLGVQANGVLKHTTGGMKSLGAGIPMNLYLTSDDELKDDDWYLEEDGSIKKYKYQLDRHCNFKHFKIIATTDKDLIRCDGCKRADTAESNFVYTCSCLCINVKSIPSSFVIDYVDAEGEIEEVEIEYAIHVMALDTMEETNLPKTLENNEVIIHIVKKKLEEQLASFELSKLAKEKGFTGFFDTTDYMKMYDVGYTEDGYGELIERRGEDEIGVDYFCLAPTLTLLQKHLRDNHKIIVSSNHYEFGCSQDDGWYYSIGNSIKKNFTGGKSKTFEKALEEGLFEVFKNLK